MSCFGGLSQVLSNIGQVLRLHCGTIVCAPGGSGQEAAEQLPLAGRGTAQEAGDDSSAAAAAVAKGTLSCLFAGLLFMAFLDAVQAASWFRWLCFLDGWTAPDFFACCFLPCQWDELPQLQAAGTYYKRCS